MIVVGPAVGFGAIAALIVIFAAGYILAYVVLEALAKRAALRSSTRLTALSEDNLYKVAIVGGLIPVVVAIVWFISAPPQSRSDIAALLTILGILVGILSFIIPMLREAFPQTPRIESRARFQPPPTSKSSPSSSGRTYRPPEYQTPNYRSQAHQAPPSATSGDPYRDLLAKARYDKNLAERLIDYERKYAPLANVDELCRHALERLKREDH